MSARPSLRLRKEARALLPYWAGTLAAVAAPHLVGSRGAPLSWLAYCFGCALLGGISFGHEFQHRTLPVLLSQPISRAAIWRDKVLTLAAALLTATAVLAGASAASGSPSSSDPVIRVGGESLRFLPFVPLCVWCGAPLFTLVAGSALGGAIFSLAVPGWCLTIGMLARLVFPELGEAVVASALILAWCPVAAVLGYRQLRSYQARPASSPALALPAWLLPWSSPSRSRPLVALLRKELRLQYGTFALVVPLWGLFFIGAVLSGGAKGGWSTVASVVTSVDLLILPLLVGAIALGEEKSLGVSDWQLSLPPSSRLQWLAKMLVTLPTSLVLGLVVPLLLVRPLPGAQVMTALVIGHLLLTHLAIYAGSLSRGTMSAVLLALGLWSAVGIAVLSGRLPEKPEGAGGLALAMGAMLVVLHLFAFSNYRRRTLRPGRLTLQGLAVAGMVATFAVLSGG
ncbi:MAG TPA: hypothetical protein VND93_29145 [Myxococcales bacterium]|nr:hypothetical protein [Myxococcales bacterium]